MASYQELGDNKYKLYVELGYNDKGKRIRKTKTVTAKSDRALRKAITDFEIEVANSKNANTLEKITFEDFVKRWFEHYVNPELAVRTAENYRYWTKSMVDDIGQMQMNKIKTLHIVQYFNNEKKVGRGCLRQKYITLKSIFSRAVKWAIIDDNPMDGVDKPAPVPARREGKIIYYNEEQLQTLLKLLEKEKPRFQMKVKLACLVGLRRSEIHGIRLNCINFKNNTILINKILSWDQEEKKYVLGAPKNKKARSVHVPKKLMKELESFVKERRKQQIGAGAAWEKFEFEGEEIELLFVTRIGKPLRPEYFNQSWGKFLKKNKGKIPELNIHGLRHSYASTLINNGINFKVIQEQMGHETIGQTINTYSHLEESKKKESTKVFDNFL